jgi:polar amino acid transport system substrate-binding protein
MFPSRLALALRLVVGSTAAALLLAACADPGSDSAPPAAAQPAPAVAADPAVAAMVPRKLKDAGEIVFATNAPYAPLEYFAADNTTLVGYDVDLGNAIGAAMGLRVRWENISFDAIIPGLQAGRYDVGMAGFSVEQERLGAVDFVSYYLSGGGFLIKKGSGIKVGAFEELCGYRVAVQKGVSQVDALAHADEHCREQGKAAITIDQIPDQNVVVLNLQSDRADVAVGDKPQVEYAEKQAGGDLCVVSTYQTNHSIAGIAVPKGNADLTAALQAAINQLIQSGTYEAIGRSWNVGVPVPGATLSADYQQLATQWGVGPDGTVSESKTFTDPAQISGGHTYYFQPPRPGCS